MTPKNFAAAFVLATVLMAIVVLLVPSVPWWMVLAPGAVYVLCIALAFVWVALNMRDH